MSGAVLIAALLHGGLAVYAYRHPLPLGPRKTGPITVDVVIRKPAPAPTPPPEPPTPLPDKPQLAMRTEPATRLPKELQPVQRPEDASAGSSAIAVPVQPPSAPGEGPVSLPDGKLVARYASTWRREADGRWKVVIDNGHDVCDCTKKP